MINLITLKNENVQYEFYLTEVKESSVSKKIVRYELKYDYIQKLTVGKTVSIGHILSGETFESFINKLLDKGFEVVYSNQNIQKFYIKGA